jgi:hypothetical protein
MPNESMMSPGMMAKAIKSFAFVGISNIPPGETTSALDPSSGPLKTAEAPQAI